MKSAEQTTGVAEMMREGERTGVLETTGALGMTCVETIDGEATIAAWGTTGGAATDMMTESTDVKETMGAEDTTEMKTELMVVEEIEWMVMVEMTGVEGATGVDMMTGAQQTIDVEQTTDRRISPHTGVEEMKEETTEEQTVLGAVEGVRTIGLIELAPDKLVRILEKSKRRNGRNGMQTLQTMRRSTKLHWPNCHKIQVSNQGG